MTIIIAILFLINVGCLILHFIIREYESKQNIKKFKAICNWMQYQEQINIEIGKELYSKEFKEFMKINKN